MSKIDRKSLINRHNIIIDKADFRAPVTIGNGGFGFTADVTGLQTFPESYRYEQPLCTLSEWGWHSFPKPDYLKNEEFRYTEYKTGARTVGYPTAPDGQAPLYNYMRANPHRFHLGMVGLWFMEKTSITDIKNIHQELDLYTGVLSSSFTVHGENVEVTTACMFENDAVAVKIKSPLLKYERLRVRFDFPYAATWLERETYAAAARYSVCEGNKISAADEADGFIKLERTMDETRYYLGISYTNSNIVMENMTLELASYFSEEIEFVVQFSKEDRIVKHISFDDAAASSKNALRKFWEKGGIIDFGECEDYRAKELEERMIRSLYITRINSCSSVPPQESGFVGNSWYGKSHLEMHYWHSAYFPLWGRPELLEKSMTGYLKYMDKFEALARRQGYKGIRIPKMIDHEFNESPSEIAPLLIWQQPHPVMLAELLYRATKKREVLQRYFELVERLCEFMLDFLIYDENSDEYILAAPYIPAQEFHAPENVKNAVYELEYWNYALTVYKKWCRRLGKTPIHGLDEKLAKLAKPPVSDGKYPAHENCSDTFENYNKDHPSMLCAYGVLPGWRMDESIVRNTLEEILKVWKWETTWGWDYALLSMCAAKLEDGGLAVDILLKNTPKNMYMKNGQVYQYPGLACYIDTNASFLLALGFLAAGCDSSPGSKFPKNWNVKIEGIFKYI